MTRDVHQALIILQMGFTYPQGTESPNFVQTTLSDNEERETFPNPRVLLFHTFVSIKPELNSMVKLHCILKAFVNTEVYILNEIPSNDIQQCMLIQKKTQYLDKMKDS